LEDNKGVYHLQNGGDNSGVSYAEAEINFANGKSKVNVARQISPWDYATLEDDPIVENLLEKYEEQVSSATKVLNKNDEDRDGDELRQIVAELYMEKGKEIWPEYDIVLGGGYLSVRSPGYLPAGDVTFAQIQGLFPFENQLVLCSVKGQDLLNNFINSRNSNYFVGYSAYGRSVKDSIDPYGTYYIVVDSYSSTYAPNRLTEIERSLDFVKEQTPLPGWMNAFPTYSMWWMIILGDYYERTGAKAFIKKQIPYLEGLIKQMDGCVKEDGTLAYPFLFVDWPTHETPYEEPGSRAINILAAKKAIALLSAFGRDTTVAMRILTRLLKVEIECGDKKQVIGLKHLAVGISEEEQKRLIEGNARGMSTFMSYYILKAVASFDKEKAVEMMKEYYGAMLDKGATSFFEDFDIEWTKNACRMDEFPKEGQTDIHGDFGAFCYKGFRHSLCHGWSAGVVTFIEEEC
jgi:hypothetical protein